MPTEDTNGRPVPVWANLNRRSNTLYITVGDRFCYVEGNAQDLPLLGAAEAAINEGRPSPVQRASYDRRTGVLTLPAADDREPVRISVANRDMGPVIAANVNSRSMQLAGRRLSPGYYFRLAAQGYSESPPDTRGWAPPDTRGRAPESPAASSPPQGRKGFIAALGRRIDRIARFMGLPDRRAGDSPGDAAPAPAGEASGTAATPPGAGADVLPLARREPGASGHRPGREPLTAASREAAEQAARAAALAQTALPRRKVGASGFKPGDKVPGRPPGTTADQRRQQQTQASSRLNAA